MIIRRDCLLMDMLNHIGLLDKSSTCYRSATIIIIDKGKILSDSI